MSFYLTLKSLHLIAVISWMAGLLYLPRIFVYHSENSSEKKITEIYSQIQTGGQHGMNTLEQCLNNLYSEGLISQEVALGKASNPKGIKF